MTVEDPPQSDKIKRSFDFKSFMETEPEKAKKVISQVAEVTSVDDIELITQALNKAHANNTSSKDFSDSVVLAIDYLLEQQDKNRSDAFKLSSHHQSRLNEASSAAIMPSVKIDSSDLQQPPNSPTSKKQPLVDLTDNDNQTAKGDEDLQRALQLSLQDQQEKQKFGGSHFSQEDQDVSRALEASLMENSGGGTNGSGAKRKRGDLLPYIDSPNPYERERARHKDGTLWPVGLKNVGQTCWFSAVIQSLFFLPRFRSLILNYQPLREHLQGTERDTLITSFMLELRKLFALLLGSERKYVDPTLAVDVLRKIRTLNEKSNLMVDNQQEDVSEFTHNLLDYLEFAFKDPSKKSIKEEPPKYDEEPEKMDEDSKIDVCNESPMTKLTTSPTSENPISLFYGRGLWEGKSSLETDDFKRNENFTQHSIPVTGSDIHDALESSMSFEEADNSSCWQEQWFTVLPPVFCLSLSRFMFNKDKRIAEKIHNRLDFPDSLFLDRYMVQNKEITRDKRKQVKKLKKRKAQLEAKLKTYTSYGNGTEKMPLHTILGYTLDYASSAPPRSEFIKDGPGDASTMQIDSPTSFPSQSTGMPQLSGQDNAPSLSTVLMEEAKESDDFTKDSSCNNASLHDGALASSMDIEMSEIGCDNESDKKISHGCIVNPSPFPKRVSQDEFQVLQSCLQRWKTDVLEDISRLESLIEEIDGQIANMYSEANLKGMEFRLHAVLVHEGNANSGHYWAYVFDPKRKCWLKCNDNTVTEATWEELQKESVGGQSHASAYSLIYLQNANSNILLSSDYKTHENVIKMEQGPLEDIVSALPNDLADFVSNDNKSFLVEKEKWTAEQEKMGKIRKQKQKDDLEEDLEVVAERLTYVNTHAALTYQVSSDVLKRVQHVVSEKNSTEALNQAINDCNCRLELYCKDEAFEPRLIAFTLYLKKNNLSHEAQMLAYYEQFSQPEIECNAPTKAIKSEAERLLHRARTETPDLAQSIHEWHQSYSKFRLAAWSFVKAADFFIKKKFSEALDLFMVSYRLNMNIVEQPPVGLFKALKTDLLIKFLCLSLREVNSIQIKCIQAHFENNFQAVKETVNTLISPVLSLLAVRATREENESSDTVQTLQEVRQEWCSLLNEDQKGEQAAVDLGEMISVILDPPATKDTEVKSRNSDHIGQADDLKLATYYTEAVRQLKLKIMSTSNTVES